MKEKPMPTAMNFYKRVEKACAAALLEELETTPKPGLVDTTSTGAHKDMDYSTFIASIDAIAPYFSKFALAGAKLNRIDNTTLEKLRPLGLQCEKAMLKATMGVNTHKGAIFSLGILAASTGYCKSNIGYITVEDVCRISETIGKAALADFEKSADDKFISNGQRIFIEYGIKGVRGEVASGFSSVRKYALPIMEKLFSGNKYNKNDIYIQVLLNLMCNVVDTNVIARKGLEAVEFVQYTAAEALQLGGALTREGRKKILELDKEYTRLNISPGGCADLLSVSIFLYGIEKSGLEGENGI